MESKHEIYLGGDIRNAKLEGPLGRRLTCQVSVLPKESKPTFHYELPSGRESLPPSFSLLTTQDVRKTALSV